MSNTERRYCILKDNYATSVLNCIDSYNFRLYDYLLFRRVIDMTIDEAEKIKMVVENKDYIVQLANTVAKIMIEAFENLKIEDVNMFQLGYNNAIDDFVNQFNVIVDEKCGTDTNNYFRKIVKEVAEQLKVGGDNEQG